MAGATPFGCGQCLPCRINRRRLWTWRMFYESQQHEDNCFVTLTYSDEHLPADGSLVIGDYQAWLKRLRFQLQPRRFRYFIVGEYGDQTSRPHYHACLFGVGVFDAGLIDSSWGKGLTATFEFNEFTAQYTAGYVVKKMTAKTDPRLQGRLPEFARMSLRPGIGAGAMQVLAAQLETDHGVELLESTRDVPTHLTIGRRRVPLGRYLRQKIRDHLNMPEGWNDPAKISYSQKQQEELLSVYRSKGGGKGNSTLTTSQVLMQQWEGRIRSIEWRAANMKKDTKI